MSLSRRLSSHVPRHPPGRSTAWFLRPRSRTGDHRTLDSSAAPRLLRMHPMRASSLCIEGTVNTPRAAQRRSRRVRQFATASVPCTSDRCVSTRSLQSSFVSRSAPVDPRRQLPLRSSVYILPLPPSPCSSSSSRALCTSSVGFPEGLRDRSLSSCSGGSGWSECGRTPEADVGNERGPGNVERDMALQTRRRSPAPHATCRRWQCFPIQK